MNGIPSLRRHRPTVSPVDLTARESDSLLRLQSRVGDVESLMVVIMGEIRANNGEISDPSRAVEEHMQQIGNDKDRRQTMSGYQHSCETCESVPEYSA